MGQLDDTMQGNESRKPKPSRDEEALRVVIEYAADLREIIEKLRKKLQ